MMPQRTNSAAPRARCRGTKRISDEITDRRHALAAPLEGNRRDPGHFGPVALGEFRSVGHVTEFKTGAAGVSTAAGNALQVGVDCALSTLAAVTAVTAKP
jgi:hypothetical protein